MNQIVYLDGYKYQLAATYSCRLELRPPRPCVTDYIALDTDGNLFITNGYAWDGPSGPTVDTKSAMRASLVHDALYQLIRLGLLPERYRIPADRELERIGCEDGMLHARHRIWRRMLNWFGSYAASPTNDRKVLTAP